MSVDFEAIAQRGRCDVSSLRLALPLLEQGYSPPFLARYRRDELGGLDESSLWALSSAFQTEQRVARGRDELHEVWQKTSLQDPAIGQAIKKSNSLRMLSRLGRRLKAESNDPASDATRLAVRVLNPQKGDGSDFAAIAAKVEGIGDADAAVAGLDQALAKRLAGDPRVIAAAVRWLVKHARIHIASISDPHTTHDESAKATAKKAAEKEPVKSADATPPEPSAPEPSPPESSPPESSTGASATETPAPSADAASVAVEAAASESVAVEAASQDADSGSAPSGESAPTESAPAESAPAEDTPTVDAVTNSEAVVAETPATETPTAETPATETTTPDASAAETSDTETSDTETSDTETTAEQSSASETAGESETPAAAAAASETATTETASSETATSEATAAKENEGTVKSGSAKPAAGGKSQPKVTKKQKKVSPRQRRRRWLVGVLKPLAGKRFSCDKLSSFQVVMLGRALRSQVAQCSFEYDATKLVAELQRTASGINRHVEQKLRDIVLAHEAEIREAAEAAWWDDLHERASARLVAITADHLRRHVNRGAVEAKVIMSVDAVGPRTAATSIVSSDGRILHNEDLPCQLTSAMRSQAVARMGELIHTHHVDLLIISNGPARRATMIALSDLIAQSPEKSLRWTLADRSGADVYASSSVADEEMRSTPRRFRAAAWLAFSVLQPAQALAKVDPLKLRLSSFQRELSDDAMLTSLEEVIVSGASRGGVDVNTAPVSWLQRLPGVTESVAQAIHAARRDSLFDSRDAVAELAQWADSTHSRQAIPFLRVFGSQEALDGTLIHPEDYALAKKLAATLEIELPPDTPPGYVPPDFSVEPEPVAPSRLVEATPELQAATVEDFSSAGESSPEFTVETSSTENTDETSATENTDETSNEVESAAETATPTEGETDAATESTAATDATSPPAAASTPDAAATTETSGTSDTPSESATDGAAAETSEAAAETSEATTPVAVEVPEPVRRPRPEKSKIDKCIKEWQIGTKRTEQLVQWLCDPFGDSDSTGSPPAVLDTMPSIKGLKQGDSVIGVVVGVMPFGVFVELAPDCSGLIHVSRVSDSYVEDLHEAVQVGDVVTAWVTGIDEKRRRVALSAVSPEREAELADARRSREDRFQRGGPRGGGDNRRGGGDRGQSRSGGQSRGSQTQGQTQGGSQSQGGGQSRGAQSRGGPSRGGDSRGGRPSGGRGRDQGHSGGRSRDNRGGRSREKKPDSYRVVGKKESKPITDAMQQGAEPLRSFGDLAQFFDKSKTPEVGKPPTKKPAAEKPAAEKPAAEKPAAEKPATEPKLEDSKPEPPVDTGETATTLPPSDSPTVADAGSSEPSDAPQANETAPSDATKEADQDSGDPGSSSADPSPPADAPTS